MDALKLTITARTAGLKASGVRKTGSVPCVVYGKGKETRQFQCNATALHKTFIQAGESTLVELDLDGFQTPVLFKEVSFDPVSGREIHADFYAVDMQKEIETHVPVRFEGEAPACKELGAIFIASHSHVRVRCLPGDLPHDLPVSIAKLAAFHDVVTVADLTLPKGVTVMETPETVLALIQEPRKEEEIAPPPAAEAVEGAASAEGEAPKEGEGGAAPGSPEAPVPGTKEKK